MSKNILLVSDVVLKERSIISNVMDAKLIAPDIKAAQDMYIVPILGSSLFKRLQAGIEASDLTNDEKDLLDDYIIDCLLNYTLLEMPMSSSYKFSNKGVVRKTGNDTDTPTMSDLLDVATHYQKRAEFYAKRLSDYLGENATTEKFPQYLERGGKKDDIYPNGTAYTCPIYLGDDDCGCKFNYS